MRKHITASAMLTPSLFLVILVLIMPLGLLARYSLNAFVPGQFMVDALTGANYLQSFTDPYYRQILLLTILMSVGVTIVCLVIGFPMARFLASTSSRYKSLLMLAIIMPLFVGNAVRAAGWMVAFGQEGLVNKILLFTGLIHAPIQMMYTTTAVFVGIVSINLSFVVLTLQSVLEGLNPSIEEASLSLGANRFDTWRLVVIPMAMPGIAAASILCLILTMNAYATPVLLGGPNFMMMAPAVADQVLLQSNWPMGAALSFVLILTTVVLTALTYWYLKRRTAVAI
ncbi:ABC transporter permease [Castellaniella sp. UC4442_H9]|nr:ABC transporter permease [Castellaniella sp.]